MPDPSSRFSESHVIPPKLSDMYTPQAINNDRSLICRKKVADITVGHQKERLKNI